MTDLPNPITMVAMVIRHLWFIAPAAVLMGSALYAWLYLTDEYYFGIALLAVWAIFFAISMIVYGPALQNITFASVALAGAVFIITIHAAPHTDHGLPFMDWINLAIRDYFLYISMTVSCLGILNGEANRTVESNSSSLEHSGLRKPHLWSTDDHTADGDNDSQSEEWTNGSASFFVDYMPGPSSEAACWSIISGTSISLSADEVGIKPEKALEITRLYSTVNRGRAERESESDVSS